MQKHGVDEFMLECEGLDIFDVGIVAIDEGIFETIAR
jgi:hypothetical protein